MGISEILTELAKGLGAFLPTVAKALLETFVAMFFVSGEAGAITGLSALGQVSLMFFVVGMAYKFLPTVLGWLKTKASRRRKRRR